MVGIHRWPVNSPHKGPVTRKMLPFDDVIMSTVMTLFIIWTYIWHPITRPHGRAIGDFKKHLHNSGKLTVLTYNNTALHIGWLNRYRPVTEVTMILVDIPATSRCQVIINSADCFVSVFQEAYYRGLKMESRYNTVLYDTILHKAL